MASELEESEVKSSVEEREMGTAENHTPSVSGTVRESLTASSSMGKLFQEIGLFTRDVGILVQRAESNGRKVSAPSPPPPPSPPERVVISLLIISSFLP